jgi:hypothetical protein
MKVRKNTGIGDRDATHLDADDNFVRLRLAERTLFQDEVVKRVSLERLSNDDGASGRGELLSGGHGGASGKRLVIVRTCRREEGEEERERGTWNADSGRRCRRRRWLNSAVRDAECTARTLPTVYRSRCISAPLVWPSAVFPGGGRGKHREEGEREDGRVLGVVVEREGPCTVTRGAAVSSGKGRRELSKSSSSFGSGLLASAASRLCWC